MTESLKNTIKATIIWQLFQRIRLNLFRRKWIRANKHNQTFPNNIFDISTVQVGKHSYGELNVLSFGNTSTLSIGRFVSIAEEVTFCLDVEHFTSHLSTYPFKVKLLHACRFEAFSKGNIVVEDDVWIGYRATIISGVHIGKGAVIAAGAIVTKDVPPYAIVAGVPAKVIKYRFSENMINRLSSFEYRFLEEERVESNLDLLYSDVGEGNIERILELMDEGEQQCSRK